MTTINKKNLDGLEKTLAAYEDLIKNPIANLKKWENYGDTEHCRMCKINKNICGDCALKTMAEYVHMSCVDRTHIELHYALKFNPVGIKKAAINRYKKIIKSLEKSGYVWK